MRHCVNAMKHTELGSRACLQLVAVICWIHLIGTLLLLKAQQDCNAATYGPKLLVPILVCAVACFSPPLCRARPRDRYHLLVCWLAALAVVQQE